MPFASKMEINGDFGEIMNKLLVCILLIVENL